MTVLDAFSGSGALAFEAISRGALAVTAIDSDKHAQRAILENSAKLGVQQKLHLRRANVQMWLKTTTDTFDLVLLDPPYDAVQPELLHLLADRATTGGTVVVSSPPDTVLLFGSGYQLLGAKNYGDAELHFYRRLT